MKPSFLISWLIQGKASLILLKSNYMILYTLKKHNISEIK